MLGFVIWVSFEMLQFDWNQSKVKDAIISLYVKELTRSCANVRGHLRSCLVKNVHLYNCFEKLKCNLSQTLFEDATCKSFAS